MNSAILGLKLLPELSQPSILLLTHVPGQGNVVDADPLPPLLDRDVHYAGVDRSGRPEYQIPVLEEVSEGGSRGGDTEEAAGLRATDSLGSGAADARALEGSRLPSPQGPSTLCKMGCCIERIFIRFSITMLFQSTQMYE